MFFFFKEKVILRKDLTRLFGRERIDGVIGFYIVFYWEVKVNVKILKLDERYGKKRLIDNATLKSVGNRYLISI